MLGAVRPADVGPCRIIDAADADADADVELDPDIPCTGREKFGRGVMLAAEPVVPATLPGEPLFWLKKGDRGVWTKPVCRLAGVVAVACEDSEDSLEREGARSCLRVMYVRFMDARSSGLLMMDL